MVNHTNLLKNFNSENITQIKKTDQKEYEARFLFSSPKDEALLKRRLKDLKMLNAKQVHPKKLFQRYIFALPNNKQGYIRVRKEYNRTTLTTKRYDCLDCNKFPSESEVIVDDFNKTYNLLKASGLQQTSYQETKRELWSIKGAELMFDQVPGLPPYVELECKSPAALNTLIKKLQLDPIMAKYGSYSNLFEELYGIDRKIMNSAIPELTFKTVKQVIEPLVKKNIGLFAKYS